MKCAGEEDWKKKAGKISVNGDTGKEKKAATGVDIIYESFSVK